MVIQSFYVDTMCILVRVQRLLASISPCAQTRMAQDLTYRGSISCSSNIPNPKVHRDPKKGMFSQDLRKVSKPHLVPWPPWLSSWQPSEAPPDPRCWDHLEAGDGARAAAAARPRRPWRSRPRSGSGRPHSGSAGNRRKRNEGRSDRGNGRNFSDLVSWIFLAGGDGGWEGCN